MTTEPTWWVQPTDAAFVAAWQRELPRILADGTTKREAKAVDAMVTAQWATGFQRPRPLSGWAR